MKRSAGSDFDEEGAKWFQSPHYKEVKTDSEQDQISKRIPNDLDKEANLVRERFYDFLNRVSREGDFKLDIDEINKVLNVRLDEIPDNYKINTIFEELNSKQNMIARGKKTWNDHESLFCIWLVMAYSHLYDKDYNDLTAKDYEAISKIFPGKPSDQIKSRWQSLLKQNLTKAPWSQEEDNLLCSIINEKGPKKWKEIAFELNKRNEINKIFRQGKQCRERWINHLDPAINRGAWTSEEDMKLLEAHVRIGKKWAEIAKILKSRTENSVKNRWNSLMKKYKGEYGIDVDTMSTSSAHSNMSMDDLEKKVSEMIISRRRKLGDSPNNILNDQIMEVPEEESPSYYSEFSTETTIPKTEEGFRGSGRKEDEVMGNDDRLNAKKGGKKKANVSNTMNNLREMVHVEIQNTPINQGFGQNDPSGPIPQETMNSQMEQQGNQPLFVFGNNVRPVANNPMNQDMNAFPQASNNQGQIPNANGAIDPRNSLYNMTNDILGLNMWRNNLNNYNVFSQNPQQNNLASNFLLYNNNTMNQPQNYNIAPASLSNLDYPQKPTSTFSTTHTVDQENKPKPVESKFQSEDSEPKILKFVERPISQFPSNDVGHANLYYAIVDLSGNQMYVMDPVTKDNYPPPTNLTKSKINVQNPGSLDILANSPAPNLNSWTSPPLNTNNLLNYPLFNNPLASFGFAKQFSPNINLFHESPKLDQNMFGSTPKMEGRGGDWTPETMNRPLFNSFNMKQRLGLANSRGDTPPDVKIGQTNGAFLRRMTDKPGVAMGGTLEKNYSSPSSFLQSNQTIQLSQINQLNRNQV